ncbi:HAD family hydrolase [Synechococcus sp. CS-1324]|uniref:HAD family hydrolase n=1 Tax=Synechococcus sp. CS-1324 TaxID=2847980 RepID=UPI000DB0D3BA|nr:HAD family hydrolase [Synechococcus sp. CS-1324]MCT0231873.1 HAD family hydrolase [Synechococcus sp. CS-1324]PZV03673.1 MAG: haloacid dehalogenase [Cyanobium sp.]
MAQLLLRGVPLGTIEAVLFDKDGTLSHSEPNLARLAQSRLLACLERVGMERRPSLRDLLIRAYGLKGEQLDPAGITAVASRFHNLIATATAFSQVGCGWPEALSHSEAVFSGTEAEADPGGGLATARTVAPTTAGLGRLLADLDQAGVILGVISNDQTHGIESFLAAHGLAHHIRGIWSADHHPTKPDPVAVLRFCSQLGVNPAASALIGDSNSDLSMAVAAGLPHALGYTAGWANKPVLAAGHPLIDHWSELTVS